jgi:dihydrofolate reductase
VARLRNELDGDIVVCGSRRLSRALSEMGLVDEPRLLGYPLVLGAGDRLFAETQDRLALRLVESRPFEGEGRERGAQLLGRGRQERWFGSTRSTQSKAIFLARQLRFVLASAELRQ